MVQRRKKQKNRRQLIHKMIKRAKSHNNETLSADKVFDLISNSNKYTKNWDIFKNYGCENLLQEYFFQQKQMKTAIIIHKLESAKRKETMIQYLNITLYNNTCTKKSYTFSLLNPVLVPAIDTNTMFLQL